MKYPGNIVPLLLGCGLLFAGCDPDCDNPKRLDGAYAVFSNTIEHTPAADAIPDEYPIGDVFYNGHSSWDFRYIPSAAGFDLTIDGQLFSASFEPSDENCNAFAMGFSGTYVSQGGGTHDFTWLGDLVYFGSHLGGTFEYSAAWSDVASGTQGHVAATGEMNGTLGDSDTGI